MVSPLEELMSSGRLGDQGVRALYQAIAAVARFDRYPPPQDHEYWNAAAVQDTAASFLAGERSAERLLQLAIMATGEESFLRLLEATVRNFFRSEARQTAAGKLFRRLRSVLEESGEFIPLGDQRYAIAGWEEAVSIGSLDALIPAAWSADIGPLTGALDVDGNIRVSRGALRELCRAVLAAARGPLEVRELLYVIGPRLGLRDAPLSVEVDVPAPVSRRLDPEEEALAHIEAEDVFLALSDKERIALVVLEDSVRDAASYAGVGKSSMAETMVRLRTKLDNLLPQDHRRGAVLARATELAVAWVGGPPSRTPDS
jgi:hypothetical protein